MTRILLVDDARGSSELFAASVEAEFDATVEFVSEAAPVTPAFVSDSRFDLALRSVPA